MQHRPTSRQPGTSTERRHRRRRIGGSRRRRTISGFLVLASLVGSAAPASAAEQSMTMAVDSVSGTTFVEAGLRALAARRDLPSTEAAIAVLPGELVHLSTAEGEALAAQVPVSVEPGWELRQRYVFAQPGQAAVMDWYGAADAQRVVLSLTPDLEGVGQTYDAALEATARVDVAGMVEVVGSSFGVQQSRSMGPIDENCATGCGLTAAATGLLVSLGCLLTTGPAAFACTVAADGVGATSLNCNSACEIVVTGDGLVVHPPNCGGGFNGYETCSVQGTSFATNFESVRNVQLLAIWTRQDGTKMFTFHSMGVATLEGGNLRKFDYHGIAQDNLGVDIECAVVIEPVISVSYQGGGGITGTSGAFPKPFNPTC